MKEDTSKPSVGKKTRAKWVSRDLKRGLVAGSAGLVGGYLVRKAKERRDRKRRVEKLKKALGGRKLIMIAVGKPSSDEKRAAFYLGVEDELRKLSARMPRPKPPTYPTPKLPKRPPTPPTVRAVKMPGG